VFFSILNLFYLNFYMDLEYITKVDRQMAFGGRV
jgi:hypothetical protein